MAEPAFVGIDVAVGKKRRLPICICTVSVEKLRPLLLRQRDFPKPPLGRGNRALVETNFAAEFADATRTYLREIEQRLGLAVKAVAIDAPRMPRPEEVSRRSAETAMDRLGISCFPTPSMEDFLQSKQLALQHLASGGEESRLPRANQWWMLAGFELFRVLEAQYECLEVYPQAISHALGVSKRHKATHTGYATQLEAAANLAGMDVSSFSRALDRAAYGKRHDRLDAFLSAWVASLDPGQREPHGSPPDDVIWNPAPID